MSGMSIQFFQWKLGHKDQDISRNTLKENNIAVNLALLLRNKEGGKLNYSKILSITGEKLCHFEVRESFYFLASIYGKSYGLCQKLLCFFHLKYNADLMIILILKYELLDKIN